MVEAGDLRDKVAVYQSVPVETETGETDYIFSEVKKIWANVVPTSGRTENLRGDVERAAVTHKVTIRGSALKLTTDTYFICRGQRLDVLYWYPVYNRAGWLEVFCKLVIEEK